MRRDSKATATRDEAVRSFPATLILLLHFYSRSCVFIFLPCGAHGALCVPSRTRRVRRGDEGLRSSRNDLPRRVPPPVRAATHVAVTGELEAQNNGRYSKAVAPAVNGESHRLYVRHP